MMVFTLYLQDCNEYHTGMKKVENIARSRLLEIDNINEGGMKLKNQNLFL